MKELLELAIKNGYEPTFYTKNHKTDEYMIILTYINIKAKDVEFLELCLITKFFNEKYNGVKFNNETTIEQLTKLIKDNE